MDKLINAYILLSEADEYKIARVYGVFPQGGKTKLVFHGVKSTRSMESGTTRIERESDAKLADTLYRLLYL